MFHLQRVIEVAKVNAVQNKITSAIIIIIMEKSKNSLPKADKPGKDVNNVLFVYIG